MDILSLHKFHIPVMGLAYTIDSPVKVARFGINSAISIIEDNLVELMRKYYYQQNNEEYSPISSKEEDHRERRITDYLNLVNRTVKTQVEKLKASAFETGSDIVKYFEMLPEESVLKRTYRQFVSTDNLNERNELEKLLRQEIKAGSIEVNIMTKVDKNNRGKDGEWKENGSDALRALKGYADSDLRNSSLIFSAGMNPRLYNYLEQFDVFDANGWGKFDKKVVIKVSDYRSALIQGKYLAKKGIWVSEFRIESGLNCGGHAFATDGLLLGPILEEFKNKWTELAEALFALYKPAVQAKGKMAYDRPHPIKLTVQGGIGSHEECLLLQEHYNIDSTGWGTPFLLCPEATTVDDHTLQLLGKAREEDIILSKSSPLGVRFNYLKGTTGEKERVQRIERGVPGSPCTEKFLVSNTEFTEEPICTASHKYQKLKLEQLQSMNLPQEEYDKQAGEVVSKECLCVGLSNAAALKYQEPLVKKMEGVTICPGPNLAYFSRVVSLQEMTDHIYGRTNIIARNDRPHMFVKELQLYVDYIREQQSENYAPDDKFIKYRNTFCKNLLAGIAYYKELLVEKQHFFSDAEGIERALKSAEGEIHQLIDEVTV